MHKKTNKIQYYHITDKAKNNQGIKEMKKKYVCVCVCVCVCLDAGWSFRLVH